MAHTQVIKAGPTLRVVVHDEAKLSWWLLICFDRDRIRTHGISDGGEYAAITTYYRVITGSVVDRPFGRNTYVVVDPVYYLSVRRYPCLITDFCEYFAVIFI